MKQITCVFFGKSGSGKGTQANLLLKYLAEHDLERKALFIETGGRFRKFTTENVSYTAKEIKKLMAEGKLLPSFAPIWIWASMLIEEYTGKEHLVFDGVCRQPEESPVLDSALKLYGCDKPTIIFLETSGVSVTKRLLDRGRHDDEEAKITERLRWFETNVMKAVSFFENNPYYNFVHINGDQTVEQVHADIKKALGI